MCLPPAATEAILTPGLSVTKQGNAERVSSPDDVLSAACLAGDTRLRFEVSSAPLLPPDTDPPLDLDAREVGLTVMEALFSTLGVLLQYETLYITRYETRLQYLALSTLSSASQQSPSLCLALLKSPQIPYQKEHILSTPKCRLPHPLHVP